MVELQGSNPCGCGFKSCRPCHLKMIRPLLNPDLIRFRTAAGEIDVVFIDGRYLPGEIRSDECADMRLDGRLVWRATQKVQDNNAA